MQYGSVLGICKCKQIDLLLPVATRYISKSEAVEDYKIRGMKVGSNSCTIQSLLQQKINIFLK